MGGVKQKQIELHEYGLSQIIDSNLCHTHIKDYAIEKYIIENGINGRCSYCKNKGKIVSLELVLIFIMKGINNFYEDAANFLPYESKEGGYQGEAFDTEELINDRIGLQIDNEELRKDIIDCILNQAWSEPDEFYGSYNDDLIYHWNYFKSIIKHKVRYFFSRTNRFKTTQFNEDAYSILKEVGRITKTLNLIQTLPPKTELYRSRQHTSKEIIKDAKQMASPPDDKAIYSNRMSPFGISMFYASFDLETSKTETIDFNIKNKPKISSAIFETRGPLNILDFSKIPALPSIFDQDNIKHLYSIKFLTDFMKDLSGNVVRNETELIEYIPTQVVTEYFRFSFSEKNKIRVDGIVYPSSKIEGKNSIVLFMDHEESLTNLIFIESSLKTENILFP